MPPEGVISALVHVHVRGETLEEDGRPLGGQPRRLHPLDPGQQTRTTADIRTHAGLVQSGKGAVLNPLNGVF